MATRYPHRNQGLQSPASGDLCDVEPFDCGASPRGPAQELETRRDTGLELKTADPNQLPQLLPAHDFDQLFYDRLKGDTM